MQSPPATGRAGIGLWLGYVAFVIYGSLVPLDFHPYPLALAWEKFQHIPFLQLGLESRADWVANGVLYLPLGFLTARLLAERSRGFRSTAMLVVATAFCIALAVAVEFTQLYFPPRTVSQNDLYAEAIGGALGAVFWPLLQRWALALRDAFIVGGRGLGPHLLATYMAAYLLLCLFPYDLLLSAADWRSKLESSQWGWWVAAGLDERGFLIGLQWCVEVAAALPFGWWLAARRPLGLAAACGFGVLLGLGIELAQFTVASGISQGISVVSRALGVPLGLWLWQRRAALNAASSRAMLRRWTWPLLALYLLLLVAVNGWFRWQWHGLEGLAAKWDELHFLPFYYHYFTTEAKAVISLGSVALMYLPLAVFGWTHALSRATTAALALLAAAVIETSKLFLKGAHPDPTNLLIAFAACWLALALVALIEREPVAAPAAGAQASTEASRGAATLLLCALAIVALSLLEFPVARIALALLLAAAGAIVWWRPVAALMLIPAALPALDLAPWSGRVFWDEFDLWVLVCLAVAGYRAAPARSATARPSRRVLALFALLASSLVASTLRGAWPWPGLDANSFSSYLSPYNALRIAKGALEAGLFIVLMQRLAAGGVATQRAFGAGMVAGLALTVAWVLWERIAFVELLDFDADYRVTGPFSAMHKGGAYIECYLAVAAPFAWLAMLRARRLWMRGAAAVLLLATSYAVMVTYSRNGYAALALAMMVMLAATLLPARQRAGPLRRRVALVAVVLAMAAVAAPILLGTFARERLARSSQDLALRQAHWADALAIRDPGLATALFGMGLGRFPDTHYWRSHEPIHAGTYRIETEAGRHFLRLGAGAAMYVEQWVTIEPGQEHMLSLSLRAGKPNALLTVAVCEKWLLTSLRCASVSLPATQAWQNVTVALDVTALLGEPGPLPRPTKLALYAGEPGSTVDVTNVRLATDRQPNLLTNGDFSAGMDRWFFSTDVDPPWHIHSLAVAILFDQGWLGVVAWAALLLAAIGRAAREAWRGQMAPAAALAALLAFGASGALNTLIDSPRLLCLLLLLCWAATERGLRNSARPPTATA